MNGQPEPQVDREGFVIVDGIKIGKVVQGPNGPTLQFCDKNRFRAAKRGTRYVELSIQSLRDAVEGIDKAG